MKFNMGCGQRKAPGYVNVDAFAVAEPDEVWDLEVTPWPWASDCADEIVFNHSLEHMGQDPKVFLAIMQEIYRIGRPGCVVQINVPHPRHDHFIGDPTHVRIINPDVLRLFDLEINKAVKAQGFANTPLALYTGVDFKLTRVNLVLDDPYFTRYRTGEISQDQVNDLVSHQYNVAREIKMTLEVRKPSAG